MMKKLTALVLTLALCLTAACMATAETEKTYTIGIAQFAEHSSMVLWITAAPVLSRVWQKPDWSRVTI